MTKKKGWVLKTQIPDESNNSSNNDRGDFERARREINLQIANGIEEVKCK